MNSYEKIEIKKTFEWSPLTPDILDRIRQAETCKSTDQEK